MGAEVDELKALFTLFTAKYGKVYTQEVLDNKEKYINARLLKILSSTQVRSHRTILPSTHAIHPCHVAILPSGSPSRLPTSPASDQAAPDSDCVDPIPRRCPTHL